MTVPRRGIGLVGDRKCKSGQTKSEGSLLHLKSLPCFCSLWVEYNFLFLRLMVKTLSKVVPSAGNMVPQLSKASPSGGPPPPGSLCPQEDLLNDSTVRSPHLPMGCHLSAGQCPGNTPGRDQVLCVSQTLSPAEGPPSHSPLPS